MEEQIGELEDRVVEITQAEQKKRTFKSDDSSRDLWINIRCTKSEKKRKGQRMCLKK